ncbi:MAG TPA: hypothetical protein VJ302_27775 [Blastocatellia bacterium]|nr:hypothetical protein [Blastocatellia bacterium]
MIKILDDDVFSPPYTAEEDFNPGDKLFFVGDSLYKWRAESRLPAAFIARRHIKAGEQVFNDPTNQRCSDVKIIWWEIY